MRDGLLKYQVQRLNEQMDRIVAERDDLRAALAIATARAAELEAKLARVEEYAEYCIAAGGASEYFASFADWLAQQSEAQLLDKLPQATTPHTNGKEHA